MLFEPGSLTMPEAELNAGKSRYSMNKVD
jgi:hypothetical protein